MSRENKKRDVRTFFGEGESVKLKTKHHEGFTDALGKSIFLQGRAITGLFKLLSSPTIKLGSFSLRDYAE